MLKEEIRKLLDADLKSAQTAEKWEGETQAAWVSAGAKLRGRSGDVTAAEAQIAAGSRSGTPEQAVFFLL